MQKNIIFDLNLWLNYFLFNMDVNTVYIYEIIFFSLSLFYMLYCFFFYKYKNKIFILFNIFLILCFLLIIFFFKDYLLYLIINQFKDFFYNNILNLYFENKKVQLQELYFFNIFFILKILDINLTIKNIFIITYNLTFMWNLFIFFIKNIIILIFFICIFFSFKIINKTNINLIRILIFLIPIVLCNLLIISIQNILLVIICMEIQNLSFIYLMSIKRHQLFINQLNLRFFIINSFGSIFLFFGSILLYRFFFTFNLLEIYSILESLQFEILEISQLYILFSLCFLIIGLFLKIGIGPFGLWIVDLYEYSPLIMIIIFSLIPKFGYLIFLYNIYLSTFSFFYFWKIIFLYLGLLSIIIGSLGALNQIKFKKLLAFSTLNYLGYIFLTFSNFNVYSSFLSMLYFLLYIFVNIFIWYIVMVLEIKLRRNIFIVDLSYLKYENNFIKLGFIFSMLYLSGLPPFYLFSLKFLTFNILKTSYLISFIFLVCNIISIFYYIRLIKILYIYNVRDIHYKYLINVIILLYVYFFFIIISYPYLFIDFNLDDCLDSCKSVKFSFLYK